MRFIVLCLLIFSVNVALANENVYFFGYWYEANPIEVTQYPGYFASKYYYGHTNLKFVVDNRGGSPVCLSSWSPLIEVRAVEKGTDYRQIPLASVSIKPPHSLTTIIPSYTKKTYDYPITVNQRCKMCDLRSILKRSDVMVMWAWQGSYCDHRPFNHSGWFTINQKHE